MPDETVPSLPVALPFAEGINEQHAMARRANDSTRAAAFAERIRSAVQAIEDAVESRPQVLAGAPVLKGTRFSIAQLFAELAEGESIDTIATDFEIDRDDLSRLLHAMAVCLNQPAAK